MLREMMDNYRKRKGMEIQEEEAKVLSRHYDLDTLTGQAACFRIAVFRLRLALLNSLPW